MARFDQDVTHALLHPASALLPTSRVCTFCFGAGARGAGLQTCYVAIPGDILRLSTWDCLADSIRDGCGAKASKQQPLTGGPSSVAKGDDSFKVCRLESRHSSLERPLHAGVFADVCVNPKCVRHKESLIAR